MTRRSTGPILTVVSLGCALVASACSIDRPAVSSSCSSSLQCPLDEVCRQPDGECVAEPDNGLLGTFRCTVAGAGSTDAGVGNSTATLLGRIASAGGDADAAVGVGPGGPDTADAAASDELDEGERRLRFLQDAHCALTDGSLALTFVQPLGADLGGELRLHVEAPLAEIGADEPVPIGCAAVFAALEFADGPVTIARTGEGRLLPFVEPEAGESLEGYLELDDLLTCDAVDCDEASSCGGTASRFP